MYGCVANEVTDNEGKNKSMFPCARLDSAVNTFNSPSLVRHLDNLVCFFLKALHKSSGFGSPWTETDTYPKSMFFYHNALLKISVLLLLQPESCQLGWPAPSWQVLILRFVTAWSLRNKNIKAFRMSLSEFDLTKESLDSQAARFSHWYFHRHLTLSLIRAFRVYRCGARQHSWIIMQNKCISCLWTREHWCQIQNYSRGF